MNDEKSPLLESARTTMAITKTRRRNEKNYSSIASASSQAVIETTAISSPETCHEDSPTRQDPAKKKAREDVAENNNENDDALVIDIEEAIDRLGMGIFQFQIVLACGLCFASDAMEYLLLSYLAVILQSQWSLSEGQSDFISSVVFLGAMMGTLVLTPLGDRLGRRIIFAVTSATISCSGILSAFCSTYRQILMARFMVGFGIGGLTVPYDTLGEFMPSSRRGKNMLSTSFFWIAASMLVPVFAWLTVGRSNHKDNVDARYESSEEGSWRVFVMLCSLPSVLSTALGIFFVPESPRWLLTRGKHEKSLEILRQAAAKNGKDPYLAFPEGVRLVDHNNGGTIMDATTQSSTSVHNGDNIDGIGDGIRRDGEMHERRQETQKFRIDAEGNGSSEFEVAPASHPSCPMCSNPKWRKISFLLGGQWYGLTFMYYGAIIAISIVFSNIKYNDDDDDDINGQDGQSFDFDYWALFISSSAEIAGLTLAISMVDRVGRVSTQVWAYSLGGFCLLLLGILDFYVGEDVKNGVNQGEAAVSERWHLILFAFLSRMFIMVATSVTWLHTAELLPTRFRATGHGLGKLLCSFCLSCCQIHLFRF
jgi:MFS family permease